MGRCVPDRVGVSTAPDIEPFFLELDRGRRFCVLHRPRRRSGRVMLHIAPFAEEMNRARRMSALAARALARDDWTVLQMDLYGCGDSEGEFEDADWATWVGDVAHAARWLRRTHGEVLTLWGVRAGCLLACDATASLDVAPTLLMWQPVVSGERHLQQFRRIEAAAGALREPSLSVPARTGASTADAPATIEVAGYRVSAALAAGLKSATLRPPATPTRMGLIQISASCDFNEAACDAWRAAGWRVRSASVSGPPFWRLQETADLPEFVEATLATVTDLQT